MEGVKVPVASPRKSRTEMDMSLIMKPEIKVEEHLDVVTEVAREILEENMDKEKIEDKNETIETPEENETENHEPESNGIEDDPKEVLDQEEKNEASEVIQEIAQVHHQEEEALTISDSLAKTHFPELLEQTHNVFEVYEQGEVIEQWYTVQPEKAASNVEVLEKLENEVDNEEDKADIKKLLAWAKSSKKKKTNTMVIREKKKLDMFKKAVDVDAVPIIIEDGFDSKPMTVTSSPRFQVKPAKKETFQVRKRSVIVPVSETVVTRAWLENAIRVFEDEAEIILVNMRFDRDKDGSYEAYVTAQVGPNQVQKSYEWIIKEAPEKLVEYESEDKDIFMIAEFGTRLVRFVGTKLRGVRAPGQGVAGGKFARSLNMPFRPVIFADGQYAIFDSMAEFKMNTDQTGLDLDHMKLALKTLAKLHAMTYAYFNNAKTDVKDFAVTLRLMVDRYYQPSASSEDKSQAKKELEANFEHLLQVVSTVQDGPAIVKKAKSKFGDRLYAIYKDAHSTSSSTNGVLCHGYPVQDSFMFAYQKEGTLAAFGKPVNAKLIKFHDARFANAMTDVQMLLCSSMGPKVEEKGEFLLRFVYHETLISTMKSLGIEPPKSTDFDVINADFKKHQAYGSLAAAMHLAKLCGSGSGSRSRGGGGDKRVFQSKILGGVLGRGDPKVMEASVPSYRCRDLLEKLVN